MKKILSFALCLLMIVTCIPSMSIGSLAISSSAVPSDMTLTASTGYNIAPGITEERIVTTDKSGNNQNESYVAIMDFNSGMVGAMAGYKDYKSDGTWGLQTVRDQANAAEAATGKNIVVAINADYFNMSTGEPLNRLVMNGTVVKDTYQGGSWYFGITTDGTPVLRPSEQDASDCVEVVGSPLCLVKDSQVVYPASDTGVAPRNAVGITADNKVVVMVNDGRQSPKSVGYTLHELGEMMLSYGCVTACYLDGGGSATYVSKTEGEEVRTVKNSPSDGTERLDSDTLFFYTTATPTGVFDHAVITPKNEVYTPGSTVKFEATGVDSVGTKVDLPEGLTYALPDDSFGTISSDGVFASNGETGTVTINLMNGETVVGTTTIDIQAPDTISFANDEVTLAFDEASDLGMTAKYQNRTVNCHDGDFVWTVESTTEGVGAAELGSFSTCDTGSFIGNTFTASDSKSGTANVTVAYVGDDSVTASAKLVIGKEPTIVMDFEDHEVTDDGVTTTVDAKDYWTIGRAAVNANGGTISSYYDQNNEFKWKLGDSTPLSDVLSTTLITAHYYNGSDPMNSRGGNESAELVSFQENEDLVRKGEYSLKLNYDFSNINGIEGACVGFSDPSIVVPGTPTGIGCWVYVPEGTPNLWLRIRFLDGTGTTVITKDYTDQGAKNVDFDSLIGHDADELITYTDNNGATVTTTIREALGGLNWTGWKYVECDISGNNGPYTLLGGETVRLMHTYSAYGGMGNYNIVDGKLNKLSPSERTGYIVIDDVQFVYGQNSADTDNPEVTGISSEGTTINNDTVITDNTPDFTFSFADVQNKYTSGINYDTVSVSIDGVSVPDGTVFPDASKDEAYIYNYYLANGGHNIKVTVKDNEDNKATLTRSFIVNGTDTTYPNVTVSSPSSVELGGTASINVQATDTLAVKSITATIKLGSAFSYKDVTYADGYEEAAAPVVDSGNNTVTISAKENGSEKSADTIFTVNANVPYSTASGVKFSYSAPNISYVCGDGETDKTLTLYQSTTYAEITSAYTIDYGTVIEGEDGIVTVLDSDGNAVKDADLYLTDGTKIGSTNVHGQATLSQFRSAQTFTFYAVKDGHYSFAETAQSYVPGANEDGTPTYVSLNASTASTETSKSITWQSRPLVADKKAVAQYCTKADYEANGEAAFQSQEGEVSLTVYDGSAIASENTVVYSNTVTITGLEADTEYVYRVGDGSKWSEVGNFTTEKKGTDTSFFIIGDAQVDSEEQSQIIKDITADLAENDYSFGVQTGDFVEKTTTYSEWQKILTAFDTDSFRSTDIIHVTGNHELFGDPDGLIQAATFNVPSRLRYSTTYGNVYVAVVGYSDNESELKETAQWLVDDAAQSDAIWKIVVTHQPVYGTNSDATDVATFRNYMSKACDEAGIDFMFSGHDHAYARTEPVKDGEVDANGTVYYVCGSAGEKKYSATDTEEFHFAFKPSQNYTGLYLTVNATADKFEVTTYDSDGSVFDTYTKEKATCNVHTYTYSEDGYVSCSVCGHVQKAVGYTGSATDEATGKFMFLVDGTPVTNAWRTNGSDFYYLGADGKPVTGTQTIDGIEYTFDDNGKCIAGSFVKETVTDSEGNSREITRYYFGGVYQKRWQEIDGKMYYFYSTAAGDRYNDGEMYYGGKKTENHAGTAQDKTFVFADDGHLIEGAFVDVTDTEGNVIGTRYFWGDHYVTEPTVVNGVTYKFDENGYVINNPITDCKFTLSQTSYTYNGNAKKPTVTVTYNGQVLTNSSIAANKFYTVSYADNTEVGTASVTITGKVGFSGSKTITYKILPKAPTSVKATISGTTANISWAAVAGASSYAVYRTVNGTQKKIATVSGTTYTNTKLTVGASYSYCVKTIQTVNSKNYYSESSKSVSVKPTLAAGVIKTATCTSYNSVKVTWSKTANAEGYIVYRATSKTGTYSRLAKVSATSYTDSKATIGKTYYYKIVPYVTNDAGTTKGAMSKAAGAKVVLSPVTNLRAKASYSSVKLSWTKVSGATGYRVYRATSKNGTYTKLSSVTTNTLKDVNLKLGKTYYYKVIAYRVSGSKVYTATQVITSAKTTLSTAKITSVQASGKGAIVTWSKVAAATGYVIYRAKSATGALTKVKTVKGALTWKDTNLKSGTYYYVVKAYNTTGSTTVYGAASTRTAVTIK